MPSPLLTIDHNHIWHPCSQMKDYELFKPLIIKRASGSYFELENGQKIIDAISSWWCKSLGHQHPALSAALIQQMKQFEHVIFANTTSEVLVRLSKILGSLIPGLTKVMYASDGSSCVEMALKMSLQSRKNNNETKRNKFFALKNGYHGETLGALSVSDVGLYRNAYQDILFKTEYISPPYVANVNSAIWRDASEQWSEVENLLSVYAEEITAVIFEPILQGAGGMKLYSGDFLKRLACWAKKNKIHLIADEIMTGFGRTGTMLACEHSQIHPDFVCLSKGMTSGYLPLSAVITTDEIYDYFYADYESGKGFMHSHTHSGNALAASVAIAAINVIKQEKLSEKAVQLQSFMYEKMSAIDGLKNIRGIGAVVAADLDLKTNISRSGYQVFQEAVKLGAYLRPLGNTIYWLPPLNIEKHTIEELAFITALAIKNVDKRV